ncbi:MAG: TrkA C-terminal domain-containing protein [Candidatus Izemoplasmatales bacterium]|nr:TrkA C-terminal domain-containing protein [Candidatus Izemoplasmatales bacterium]
MDVNRMILLGMVVLLIYFFFIEIFTVLFRLTGMTKSKSRFQVISLFTNSGYTTQEAELIMNHQLRRRLANTTMLFGYILNVTVISVLINIIMTLGTAQSTDVWKFVIYLGSFFILLTIIGRIRFIDRFFQNLIKRVAVLFLYRKNTNILEVLDHYDNNAIVEVALKHVPTYLEGIPLKDNGLKTEHGLTILAIQRNNHTLVRITGEDLLLEGDLVVVFGSLKQIREVFLTVEESESNQAKEE